MSVIPSFSFPDPEVEGNGRINALAVSLLLSTLEEERKSR